MTKETTTENVLTMGVSGFPDQLFVKLDGKVYRHTRLAGALNKAMWMIPTMTLIERLERHLKAGVIGRIRCGKASTDLAGDKEYSATFYCAAGITDTGAHGPTLSDALSKALDNLDDKVRAKLPPAPKGLPLPTPKGPNQS